MNCRQKLVSLAVALLCCTSAQATDADIADALIRRNNCSKCHDVAKEGTVGPSFKVTANKYRDNAQAEEKLITHLTTAPVVKFPDGSTDEHRIVRTTPSDDMEQLKGLIRWILSH